MPNAFDIWFQDSHTCDIKGDYCRTHDSTVSPEELYCDYAIEDPLNDPYDAAVEDGLTE